MEQVRQPDAEPTAEFLRMNKNEFYERITIKKDDRYALIFFYLK